MSLDTHPYGAFLHTVNKPARYAGGEYNQIQKDPDSVSVQMALAFPDVYDIGMSHLGTKILYSLLNKHPDILAERVFCPWVDMEKELRERGLPLLTLESARPLTDFDVVGFSLQYELTYTNILNMLDLSGIPLRSEDRTEDHPLIFAGGPCATQPEPIAPMIDAFLIGDAEEKLPEMLLAVSRLKREKASREEMLIELAALEGVYCPSLYETEIDEDTGFLVVGKPRYPGVPEQVKREIVEDLSKHPFPDDAPVAAAEAIFDRMAIEIARGCTEGCRFCQAGMIYRPVRERDPEEIVETITSAIEKGGYDEVGLTTLSTADYSCISPLIKKVMSKLRPEKTSLSVASLRAYGLDEDLLDEIRSVRATGLTFAPEAGTQRMRDVVNKNISEEDLTRTAERVFSRGWRRMKLYFMIGLPTEMDEDVAGIMETGRRMKDIGARYHKRGALGVTVSVSSHVPKPHTPFQWCAMDTMDEIERKQDMLFALSRRHRLEFRRHDPRTSYLECILGRGDRRVADVIESAYRKGARFDSWDDQLRWDAWVEAMKEADSIPYDLYLGTLKVEGRLPWDHLDMQLTDRFLATEYKRAMKDKLSPPCGKPVGAQVHHTNLEDHEQDERILVCYHCGVACDMTQMREERGEFLDRLGAYAPPAPNVEPVQQQPVVPTGAAPHDFGQGERHRYRVTFSKTGIAALTGHLDLTRSLPRIVRRAGLGAYYSEGFHPKPVMEFPPPLPLGVTGLREIVDMSLAEPVGTDELIARLREFAPEGIDFLDAESLNGGPKLSREVAAADYVVWLSADQLSAMGPVALDAAPDAFLARDSVPMEVVRKRRPKTVDIRPGVQGLRWLGADEVLEGVLKPAPGERLLWFRGLVNDGAHVRPEEAAAAILGKDLEVEPTQITRLGWLRRTDTGWEPLTGESLTGAHDTSGAETPDAPGAGTPGTPGAAIADDVDPAAALTDEGEPATVV